MDTTGGHQRLKSFTNRALHFVWAAARSRWRLACLLTLLLGTAWCWVSVARQKDFHDLMSDALAGTLQRASLQPHVDREMVVIDDPADLAAMRAALLAAHPLPAAGSYPGPTCKLRLDFAAKESVWMNISPAGQMRTSVLRQDAAAMKGLGYLMIEFRGRYRAIDDRPFLEALRRRILIAAPEPATTHADP